MSAAPWLSVFARRPTHRAGRNWSERCAKACDRAETGRGKRAPLQLLAMFRSRAVPLSNCFGAHSDVANDGRAAASSRRKSSAPALAVGRPRDADPRPSEGACASDILKHRCLRPRFGNSQFQTQQHPALCPFPRRRRSRLGPGGVNRGHRRDRSRDLRQPDAAAAIRADDARDGDAGRRSDAQLACAATAPVLRDVQGVDAARRLFQRRNSAFTAA